MRRELPVRAKRECLPCPVTAVRRLQLALAEASILAVAATAVPPTRAERRPLPRAAASHKILASRPLARRLRPATMRPVHKRVEPRTTTRAPPATRETLQRLRPTAT